MEWNELGSEFEINSAWNVSGDQGLHKSYMKLSERSVTQGEMFLASWSAVQTLEEPGYRCFSQSYLFLLGEENADVYIIFRVQSNIQPGT